MVLPDNFSIYRSRAETRANDRKQSRSRYAARYILLDMQPRQCVNASTTLRMSRRNALVIAANDVQYSDNPPPVRES
jgi:hypothetical protein